ncbi:hypothetical protein [Burkholderia ubonensis]|uniref:hypothetical protein n=1 Tax=Burkholderia ubonensis TaxID=101571 RepID=UPI0007539914|nr:hypothetical protein [Burkholderia ubonensis]KWK75680.1 hypothetical protein WM15_31055 [Burkholderia ubonensis]
MEAKVRAVGDEDASALKRNPLIRISHQFDLLAFEVFEAFSDFVGFLGMDEELCTSVRQFSLQPTQIFRGFRM